MDGEKIERLRRHSLWLSRLTLFLFGATALVILIPITNGFGSVIPADAAAPHILFRAVFWLPTFFYLYALWAIGRAFGAFARGGLFGSAVAKGCRRAGVALAVGASASALGVPNAIRLLAQHGLVPEPLRRFGSVLIFDTAYLAVGVVGIALFLLGGLLERAAEVQQEAQDLRAELGEFF
ncbi:MAG TPA: DUF2975 domain-containing protein [Allosphingosinicella sp.]|jgi:hypothetical protein